MKKQRILSLVMHGLAATLLTATAGGAVAQEKSWPERPIRLIVPYPPGGGTDIVARLLAPELGKQLGENVVVENRPGGSTVIGTGALARSEPDGYTIGLVTDSHVLNPHYIKDLPYDSVKDFAPVSQLVNVPFIMVASPKIDVKNVQELVAAAKARPGEINYASIGNGTPHFLAMELFKNMAKVDLTHIPYAGVAPALKDVVGNQVDVMFTGLSSGLPLVDAGTLVGLAVSPAKRMAAAPNIPTVAESGYPDFAFNTWYGILAPAGTPASIVNRLSKEIGIALDKPAIKERLASLGVDTASSTPEGFAQHLKRVAAQYEEIIASSTTKK